MNATGTREQVLRAIARRERREARSRWKLAGLLAAGVLVIDQLAKIVVRASLEPRDSIDLVPGLALTRVNNTGIAFGLFPGRASMISLLTLLALCAIGVALAGLVTRNPLVAAGAGMLIGGSLGNLIDRVRFGAVTDFIDPARWPAFNLADVGIVVGSCLIVVGLLNEEGPAEPDGEP